MADTAAMDPESLTYNEVVVSNGGAKAEFNIRALSIDDFDRTGNFSLWKISKLFEWARIGPMKDGKFLDFARLRTDPNLTFFIMAGHYDITKRFYKQAATKRVNFPLTLGVELLSYSPSSLTYISKVSDPFTGEVYATLKLKYVAVDTQTRKPKPFPAWHQEKYKHKMHKFDLGRFQPKPIPATAFKYECKVAPSDIDFNLHSNQSNYPRWCLDAATTASYAGHFRVIKGDVCKHNTRQMVALYAGESRLHDRLTVYVWQDEDKVSLLHFQVQRAGKAIFHADIELYFDQQAKL